MTSSFTRRDKVLPNLKFKKKLEKVAIVMDCKLRLSDFASVVLCFNHEVPCALL